MRSLHVNVPGRSESASHQWESSSSADILTSIGSVHGSLDGIWPEPRKSFSTPRPVTAGGVDMRILLGVSLLQDDGIPPNPTYALLVLQGKINIRKLVPR